jgi:hypothetical protein
MIEIWLGYKVKTPEKPFPSMLEVFKCLENPPLCIVQSVDDNLAQSLNKAGSPYQWSNGQWLVTVGEKCDDMLISAPLPSIDEAFDFAMKLTGANKFLDQPKFNDFKI